MQVKKVHFLVLASLLVGCAGTEPDPRERCTREAVGEETGSANLDATLQVPDTFMTGVEISNGGIMVLANNCDFPLNAFMSDETAEYIVENAPRETIGDRHGVFRLVEASLSIWRFSDGSGKTRFFVTGVHELRPIMAARSPREMQYYSELREAR